MQEFFKLKNTCNELFLIIIIIAVEHSKINSALIENII